MTNKDRQKNFIKNVIEILSKSYIIIEKLKSN